MGKARVIRERRRLQAKPSTVRSQTPPADFLPFWMQEPYFILDPALDPNNDRRVREGLVDPRSLNLVAEEMIEWGLNPDEIEDESYLEARMLWMSDEIRFEQIPVYARKFQRRRDRRNLLVADAMGKASVR